MVAIVVGTAVTIVAGNVVTLIVGATDIMEAAVTVVCFSFSTL